MSFAKRFWEPIAMAALVSASCFLLLFGSPAVLSYADNKALDLLVFGLPRHPPTGETVIVDIDELSLAKVGRWPWPRDVLAKLIDKLWQAKAAVIVSDIMFPEPGAASRDHELAAALATSRSVIGYNFLFDSAHNRASGCELTPKPLVSASVLPAAQLDIAIPEASAVICNTSEFAASATKSGFLNALRDRDGTIRRAPLLAIFRDALYPSLALSAVIARSFPDSGVLVRQSSNRAWIQLGRNRIGLTDGANILLRYRGGEHALPYHSAVHVLNQPLNTSDYAGKVIVIGSSAQGLQESVETPFQQDYPGIEIQATAIDNLIGRDYFHRPRWAIGLEIAAIVPAALLAIWLLCQLPPILGVLCTCGVAALLWTGADILLLTTGAFISPTLGVCACLGTLGVYVARAIFIQGRVGRESKEDLAMANQFITGALGAMTAVRDVETGQHVVRIQAYLQSLCHVVAKRPRFAKYLTPQMIDLLVQLAPIHDIGKVGVPDHILRKPGVLTRDEFELMKSHVALGKKILEDAREQSGLRNQTFFQAATDIVYSHHERWDGSGYPLGLAGDAIPIPGRLLAITDVYDALISKRHYKPEILHKDAVENIRKGAGTHFDPDIVSSFLEVQDDWRRMAEAHRDQPGVAAVTANH